MTFPSFETRVGPLLERLEASREVVDARYQRKADRALIQSLKDGSFGVRELDLLFEAVEKPLLATVTIYTNDCRGDSPYRMWDRIKGDPFSRAVVLLAEKRYRFPGDDDCPAIDLLGDGTDRKALGPRGTAQVELVRQLVIRYGSEEFQRKVDRVSDDPEHISAPQVKTKEECARLLRLMAPIERDHILPMLQFLSPTGRLVHSAFIGSTQCVLE